MTGPKAPLDEQALIRKAQAGDREAFDQIVLAYQAHLRSYVARVVPSSQDVYDIVQEVFLNVYQGLSKVDSAQPFNRWLFRVCRNHVCEFLRKRYRRFHAAEAAKRVDEFLAGTVAQREEDEDHASEALRVEALRACVGGLQDRHRQLIVERYQQGLSLKELAGRMNATGAALAMSLMRLRTKLQECVKKRLGEAFS